MTSPITYPRRQERALLADVRAGLTRRQKTLPSKYFYDHRGSTLFEEITRLSEYYLTRAERRLLQRWMPALMAELGPSTLIELGAGSGEKTRIILDAMCRAGTARLYVPVDVSAEFLDHSASRLHAELPSLTVRPVVADFTEALPSPLPREGRALFAFLGSTIGNLDEHQAIALLRRVRQVMAPGDRFLMGADLFTKPVERIVRAYNDAAGVTAEFNRNILRVVNRELGAAFPLDGFEHRAIWSWAQHRIEMHLVATREMRVPVPGLGMVGFHAGESIRTELCTKYDRTLLERMLGAAGLALETWHVDAADQYALLMAAPHESSSDT
ncbi:MAG TPA: L-histidine N(alpha)-methyltransferase [Gemmatimonadaceae bacterium]